MALALTRSQRKHRGPPAVTGREKRDSNRYYRVHIPGDRDTCPATASPRASYECRFRWPPSISCNQTRSCVTFFPKRSLVSVAQLVEHRSVAQTVAIPCVIDMGAAWYRACLGRPLSDSDRSIDYFGFCVFSAIWESALRSKLIPMYTRNRQTVIWVATIPTHEDFPSDGERFGPQGSRHQALRSQRNFSRRVKSDFQLGELCAATSAWPRLRPPSPAETSECVKTSNSSDSSLQINCSKTSELLNVPPLKQI